MPPYLLYHLLEPVHLGMRGTSSYYQLFSIMLPQDDILRAEFFRFLSRCIHIRYICRTDVTV